MTKEVAGYSRTGRPQTAAQMERNNNLRKRAWKPGQTGNPKGRPKGSVNLAEHLKRVLRDDPKMLETVLKSLIKEATMGNVQAIKEIFDRVDGRPTETHKIEGELPIKIEFVPAAMLQRQERISLAVPEHEAVDVEYEVIDG